MQGRSYFLLKYKLSTETKTQMLAPYLSWLLIFVALPMGLLWVFNWPTIWKYRYILALCMAISVFVGLIWDYLDIQFKIWGWPSTCCTFPRVAGLPTEEILFMCLAGLNVSTMTLVARHILLSRRMKSYRIRR